ncbi:MAG: NAD(+)/NADH kinase, partial [Eggerthellaceae bacterium]|nr:NAD(+)/NADH kinase [Eggerthellaceae bacterium]
MKLLVINNLVSGYREGAIYDFIRMLIADGDEVVIRSTDGTSDIPGFLTDAHEYDLVVASGGDGTIATVAYELANTKIPILAFPAGTANLLHMNLLLPNETHALAKLAREGNALDFDLGEILLENGDRLGFSIMAGAGYDADIMKNAAPHKRLLGPMAYFSAAIANPTPKFSRFTLEIDGETFESEGVGVLIINFSKIQFDISVIHENLPRDGMLEVVVLKARDALGLVPALFAGILDRGGEFPNRTEALEIHRGKQIRIDADPPLHIQYDGEASEFTTPFSVGVVDRSARFLVSEECLK